MEGAEKMATESSREEQAEKLVNFLQRTKAEQVFNSKENKIDFINGLTFDGFRSLIERVNGIVRDIPMAKRRADGGEVALVPNPEQDNIFGAIVESTQTEYPPREADKEGLLKEMFDLVKKMAQENSGMEDIALLCSAGVNAVHAFADGNGRTSRLIDFLLETDYIGSPEQIEYLKKLLGENGRLFVNIDPGKAKHAVQDYIFSHDFDINENDPSLPKYLGTHVFSGENLKEKIEEKVPLEIQTDFERHIIEKDGDYSFFAVYYVLKKYGKLDKVATPIVREGEVVGTDLRTIDVVDKLEPEELREILETYWRLKKEGVSILMKAVEDPENYTLEARRYGGFENGQTIKEVFVKEIDDGYRSSFLEVNQENINEIWTDKETLPFSTGTLSSEEMQNICETRRQLNEITEQEKLERESLAFDFEKARRDLQVENEEIKKVDSPVVEGIPNEVPSAEAIRLMYEAKQRIYKPVLDISKKYLDQVVTLLDGLNIWASKFTTRNKHQWATEEELEETDSIYYVTKSGQSLRLIKYALLEGGLAGVIMPFMEKIFFEDEETNTTEEPKEGEKVIEYITDEFVSAQKEEMGKEFKSTIRRYEKEGKIIYLNPVDGNLHRGYEIHKIFDISK